MSEPTFDQRSGWMLDGELLIPHGSVRRMEGDLEAARARIRVLEGEVDTLQAAIARARTQLADDRHDASFNRE